MATIKRFEDLDVWKDARKLADELFKIIISNESIRDFKYKDQLSGSSGSIMDNIAEGFEGNGNREFIQFLSIAKGSCGEVRSQLHRAYDRNYITKDQFDSLLIQTRGIGKNLGGFISYLSSSNYRGSKYKVNEPPVQYLNNHNIES